ncbi:MAG: methionine adenosyltransferase [Treponema sp.]|nr:methionine adenosyltransferase [Treponema sp.]
MSTVLPKNHYLFTSESVSEGHPDKLCDQVSDAILDACLKEDPSSHVACETFATTGMVLVGGEITTKAVLDVQKIVRDVVRDIGYTDEEFGISADSMSVMNVIHTQSPDINQGVAGKGLKKYKKLQGAGDQGIMFGFATNETPEYMPATLVYAHQILKKAAELRKSGAVKWLRPDSKSQVTIEYDENHKPVRIDAVVVSHQHDNIINGVDSSKDQDKAHEIIEKTIIEKIIKPVLEPTGLLDKNTKYYINPTGRFVVGGPHGDSGLTGRKIIVDTYGGMGRHGGGAFSGKDPSKVDRSAAYMARYIAKNIVAAHLADRAEIQLSYAIGVPHPVSIMVDTFGTGKVSNEKIAAAVEKVFDCSPAGIEKTLDLRKPVYRATVNYGHFGRKGFAWEKTDKVKELKEAVK